jgi:hypothetical protein
MRALSRFLENPWTNIVVALILIGTSGIEVWEDFAHDTDAGLGAHHGILVFGVVSLLKAVPDAVEGVQRLVARHRE